MQKKDVISWIIVLVGPFLVITVYLLTSRAAFPQGTTIDFIAVTVSVFAGLYGVIRLPYALGIKAIAIVVYIAMAYWALFYYSSAMVCAVLDICA